MVTYLIRVPASAQSVELMLLVSVIFSNNSATKCTRALGNQTSPRRPNCFMAVISEVIHKPLLEEFRNTFAVILVDLKVY